MTNERTYKNPTGLLGSTKKEEQPSHPATKGIPPSKALELWSMFSRPVVEGLYYNNKEVKLDGYHFIGCRFDNCVLIATTTNFELTNCVLDASTSVTFGDDLLKVIRLFNRGYDWVYELSPSFAPLKNPDGSITINGDVR